MNRGRIKKDQVSVIRFLLEFTAVYRLDGEPGIYLTPSQLCQTRLRRKGGRPRPFLLNCVNFDIECLSIP